MLMCVALVFVFISIDLYTLPATQEHSHAPARHGGEADEDGVGVGEVGHACVVLPHTCIMTHTPPHRHERQGGCCAALHPIFRMGVVA